MRFLIYLGLALLTACGTAPHQEPAIPALVEVSEKLHVDEKLLQDCKRLPLLPRTMMTRADVIAYNDDWIARHEACRLNNREVVNILKQILAK